jgi:hypothetical protein
MHAFDHVYIWEQGFCLHKNFPLLDREGKNSGVYTEWRVFPSLVRSERLFQEASREVFLAMKVVFTKVLRYLDHVL